MNVQWTRMAAIGLVGGCLMAASVDAQAGIFFNRGRSSGYRGGYGGNYGGGCSRGSCGNSGGQCHTGGYVNYGGGTCYGGACQSNMHVHSQYGGQVMQGCAGGACQPANGAHAHYGPSINGQQQSGYRGVPQRGDPGHTAPPANAVAPLPPVGAAVNAPPVPTFAAPQINERQPAVLPQGQAAPSPPAAPPTVRDPEAGSPANTPRQAPPSPNPN